MSNHFDPFIGSKLPSELKRPLRRVKTTILQKGTEMTPWGQNNSFEFTVYLGEIRELFQENHHANHAIS